MPTTESYQTAQRRAEAKCALVVHAGNCGAVMVVLTVVDMPASTGKTWFAWPLFGWGLTVAPHAARVCLLVDGNAIMDALDTRGPGHLRADRRDEGENAR